MSTHTETEERNLGVVRQMFGEADGPADKSDLFADDATWWNGLPRIPGAEGETAHVGKEAIRNLLPSTRKAVPVPGSDSYDMSTARVEDVVMLADGDWVVRQQTFRAKTFRGQDYCNVYCFVFRFGDDGKIAYLTEHWNTWHANNVLFGNYAMEPAHPQRMRSASDPRRVHPVTRRAVEKNSKNSSRRVRIRGVAVTPPCHREGMFKIEHVRDLAREAVAELDPARLDGRDAARLAEAAAEGAKLLDTATALLASACGRDERLAQPLPRRESGAVAREGDRIYRARGPREVRDHAAAA